MPYKDRTVGLVIFGILTILLGIGSGGLLLLTLVGQAFVPADQRVDIGTLLPALGLYGGLGIVLIVLGIGSCFAQRWARALILIFSWSWLAIGVIECVSMAFILPMILANVSKAAGSSGQGAQAGELAVGITMMFIFGILGFFFIVLPGIWTFFYMSPHVKATCEARHPEPGWTDRCPLPVLGLSLWLWFCVPMLLLMPLSGHLVLPLFGALIHGTPAIPVCLVFAAIWSLGGWLTYRVDMRGWWLVVIAVGLGAISSILTFSMHDMIEIYKLGNYPQAQIDQVQKMGLFTGHAFVWVMVLSMVPFFGYLFYVRRFFLAKSI